MTRSCERPGCSALASIAYGIDPDRLTVWLDALDDRLAAEPWIGVLCRRHADAMVVPLGWMLDDHRELAPRLFKVGETDATGEIVRRRRGPALRGAGSEQLELAVSPLSTTPVAVATDEVTVSERIEHLLADDTAQLQRTVLRAEREHAEQVAHAAEVRHPQHAPADEPPAPREVAAAAAPVDHDEHAVAAIGTHLADEPGAPQPDADASDPAAGGADEPPPEQFVAATLWSPVFDEADDLGGLLTARSPLLSRAFGNGTARPRKARKRA